jgi:hypothetical protein
MVDMVLVTEVSVLVVHVLAGVDVEVLLLFISDFEDVFLDVSRVLTEESSYDWVIALG